MFSSKRSNIGKRGVSDQHGSVLGPRWHGMRSPTSYSGLQAWYDVSDASSMVIDGSNRVSILSDKSGNSATNCLVLNGAAGNYASIPNTPALNITVDIDVMCLVAMNDWTPTASSTVMARWGSGNQAFALNVGTTGNLEVFINGLIRASSLVSVSVTDNSMLWVRVTRQQSTGDIKFYTGGTLFSPLWVQLGTNKNWSPGTAIISTTTTNTFGSLDGGVSPIACRIYRGMIYNGYDGAGTLQLDANFALAAKLATSFTESSVNAATVTINTSGATGARISGERDLYWGLTAGQPVYSLANRNITFDGSDDGLRTPGFLLSQPLTAFLVGSQVSWSSGDYILDGRSSTNTMALTQTTSTPRISMSAGSLVAENSDWTVGTTSLVQAQFNGASSSIRIGRGTATTGSAGTGAPNGITLGSLGGTANFGNFTMSELVVFSEAADAALQNRMALYANRKWGTSI